MSGTFHIPRVRKQSMQDFMGIHRSITDRSIRNIPCVKNHEDLKDNLKVI